MKMQRPSGQATSWQRRALSKAVPCVHSWKGMYRCVSTMLCVRSATGQQQQTAAEVAVLQQVSAAAVVASSARCPARCHKPIASLRWKRSGLSTSAIAWLRDIPASVTIAAE